MAKNKTAEQVKATLAEWQGNETYDPNQKIKLKGSGGAPEPKANPLVDLLTERLTQQGQGISSSASTNLQASIDDAIAGTQEAGALTSAALDSKRQREVGFAQDRAGATYSGAMEGRKGYATQVVALRELTETTEKSIRDLDMRYNEAIMMNDAETMKSVSDLEIKKLEFLQKQEQDFYDNVFKAANLTQQQMQMEQQSEQFWADQGRQSDQFASQMAQSEYQFEETLGLQYEELGLKEQELDIARERNQISWADHALKKSEINKEKNFTTTQGLIQQRMVSMAKSGVFNDMDPLTIASTLRAELEGSGFEFDGTTEEFATIVMQSYLNVKGAGIGPDVEDTPRSEYSTIGGFFDYHFGDHPFYRNTGQFGTNRSLNESSIRAGNIDKAREDLEKGVTISAP